MIKVPAIGGASVRVSHLRAYSLLNKKKTLRLTPLEKINSRVFVVELNRENKTMMYTIIVIALLIILFILKKDSKLYIRYPKFFNFFNYFFI